MPGFIDTPLLRNPSAGSNRQIRDVVQEAGLELTSAETVAEAAWNAVHGEQAAPLCRQDRAPAGVRGALDAGADAQADALERRPARPARAEDESD